MAALDLSGFPDDMLALLAERLPSLADSLRYGAVCRSWASAARKRRPGTYLPFLLVPDSGGDQSDGDSGNGRLYNLFCLSGQKAYGGLRFPEEARHWRYFGSCHDWLATVDLDGKARLLNPMSGAQAELPPLSTFPDIIDVIEWPIQGARGGEEAREEGAASERRPLFYVFEWLEPDNDTPPDEVLSGYVPCGYDGTDMRDVYMVKMCMSSSEPLSDPNCVVMVIYSGMHHLACCKPGDSKWTAMHTPWRPFEDVIYHRGMFYAVNQRGRVVVVDGIVDGGLSSPSVREVAPPPRPHLSGGRKYLVGLPSGELLLAIRRVKVEPDPYQTDDFQVFKVDISSARPEWQKVNSLGELALFLGHNSSVSISSSEASGSCRGNCIYFADDYIEGYNGRPFGGHDMRVFDVETKSIERYYATDSQLLMPPPLWILPNPR